MANILEKYDASHSQVEAFKTCPRRHFYGYGLGITSNTPGIQLVRGIIGHAVLAEYYQGLKDGLGHDESRRRGSRLLAVLITETPDFYNKDSLQLELATTLRDYFRWVEPEAEEIQVLEVEKVFEARINENFSLPFVVDLIVRVPGSGIEAWDHKFVWDFFNPKTLDLSPQLPLYYAGLRMLGSDKRYATATVRYNEIRYRNTREIEGDYTKRFNRPAPRISKQRVIQTMEEHIRVGETIYRLRQLPIEEWDKWAYRTGNNKTCTFCGFQAICVGDLNGEDRRNYIGVDYKKKVKRETQRVLEPSPENRDLPSGHSS